MVLGSARFAQVNRGQTKRTSRRSSSLRIDSGTKRSASSRSALGLNEAALHAMALRTQEAAVVRARETWRDYRLWRNGCAARFPFREDRAREVLGLYTPSYRRVRVPKGNPGWLCRFWMSPDQRFVVRLNEALRAAGSEIRVRHEYELITEHLLRSERRQEAGVKKVGTCPRCGGNDRKRG